jgi:hypothetical protein
MCRLYPSNSEACYPYRVVGGDLGCGGRLSWGAICLLELSKELGRSALGRAVGEMEDCVC